MPFTAAITGFCTCWCHAVKCRSHSIDRVAVALDAHAVARQLLEIDPGLERAAFAGVHDDPHGRIGVELEPGVRQLVAHLAAHRVELLGPVVHQPPHRTVRSTSSVS